MKSGLLACLLALQLPLAGQDPFVDVATLEGEYAFAKGALSLAIKPKADGKVYLVNDTEKPVEGIVWRYAECTLEAKIGGVWKRCEPLDLDSFGGGVDFDSPPPLTPRKAFMLSAADGTKGDQEAEMRYALNFGDIVSTTFRGRYWSRVRVVAEELEAVVDRDWRKYPFAHSAEEFVALLELDRHYGDIQRKGQRARDFVVTMGVDDQDKDRFEATAMKVLGSPQPKNQGERALFKRCLTALATAPGSHAYGSPEKCRAMVWRRLARPPGSSNNIDSEPKVDWEAIRASGNPWGVDKDQLVVLVDLALIALSSEDETERAEAGTLLRMDWVREEHLPKDGIAKLLKLDTREAKETADAIRGRAAAAEAAP